MTKAWIVEHLEDFERFYRSVGLLGHGLRLTPADRDRIADTTDGSLVWTEWLREQLMRGDEPSVLDAIDSSNVLSWNIKNIWYPDLVHELPAISRGSFVPTDLTCTHHDAGYRGFDEVRCTWAGIERCMYIPGGKWLHQTLFYELNRWIADGGRRFAIIGYNHYDYPIYGCISDAEAERLAERTGKDGPSPRFAASWDDDPAELLTLTEHFAENRQFQQLLDVTTFNPELAEQVPELYVQRARAHAGLGREDGAWEAVALAHRAGIADAAQRVTSWLETTA